MRLFFITIAAVAVAAPAAATQQQAQAGDVAAAQQVLRDPATAQTMARVSQALTRSIMSLPVGELEAAIEGRQPTPADRRRTVQDNLGGPQATARIEREVAASGAQVQALGHALADALPGLVRAASQVQQDLERAVANLPDPTYPAALIISSSR